MGSSSSSNNNNNISSSSSNNDNSSSNNNNNSSSNNSSSSNALLRGPLSKRSDRKRQMPQVPCGVGAVAQYLLQLVQVAVAAGGGAECVTQDTQRWSVCALRLTVQCGCEDCTCAPGAKGSLEG